MGTVHAKSLDKNEERSSGEKNDRIDLQSLKQKARQEQHLRVAAMRLRKTLLKLKAQSIMQKLQHQKAQVQRVHVSGIGRTKEDIVIKSVKDVFQASNFQSVVLKIHEARSKLEELGCFKGVDVLIDTYDGADALEEGIQVTFEVKEVRVLGAQATTAVGQNEALFSGGGAFRNIFGRGEYCNASYSKGTKKTSSFGVNFVKPLHDDLKTKLTANIYQGYLEAGWSGYKEVDRGAALGLDFCTAPHLSHKVTAEAAWRHLTCLSKTAAFGVREHSGHSLKTALKYQLDYDTRDQHIFPTRGQLFRFQTEAAGYGGSVGFSKNEVTLQANQELPLDVVAQVSLSGGFMAPLNSRGHTIADRFFMGGPMTFRGFQMGGVGPHSEKCALGAQSYWLGSAHLYAPLPLLERGPFLERFRLHGWTSMGTCGDLLRGPDAMRDPAQAVRMSLGAGVALNLAGMARVELNYCVPVKHQPWDKPQPGLQFGVAADIL